MSGIMSCSSRLRGVGVLCVAAGLAASGCKKAEAPSPAPAAAKVATAQTPAVATVAAAPASPPPMAPTPQAAAPSQGATPTAVVVKLQTQKSPEVKLGETTKCPIMGEEFVIEADSDSVVWNGKKIYFCCPGKCKKKFEKDPLKFLPAT